MAAPTLGQVWRQARDRLASAGIPEAARDAKLLAQIAFGADALQLALRETEAAPESGIARLETLVERRLGREPVARIAGEKEFFGLTFELNADTLVPRPETELLVELGLERLAEHAAPSLLDLGTGTGCIAISLLFNLPQARGVATDLSAPALDMATRNAQRHGVASRLVFRQGDWLAAVEEGTRFDLIVTNPPYITPHEFGALDLDVRDFDPHLALVGGDDGLSPYREIARNAGPYLREGGCVIMEHGAGQRDAIVKLFSDAGFSNITHHDDLAGHDRVVIASC